MGSTFHCSALLIYLHYDVSWGFFGGFGGVEVFGFWGFRTFYKALKSFFWKALLNLSRASAEKCPVISLMGFRSD